MTQYVLTAISHNAPLKSQIIETLYNDLKKNIKTIEIDPKKETKLGERANDIYFTTSDECDVRSILLKDGLSDFYLKEHLIDLIVQKDNNNEQRHKKAIIFDMDSTLIKQEVIEMIAKYGNVEAEVKKITDRAMNNELNFSESLTKRVALLKGIKIEELYDNIKKDIIFTNGIKELSKFLKTQNYKLAVLSGGFKQFAEYVYNTLDFDYFLANELDVNETGEITGNLLNAKDLVDGDKKASEIQRLSKEWGIPLDDIMMVGDGGNDLKAMNVSGFGIAWNAKPIVQMEAPGRLNSDTLYDLKYILGYKD